VKQQDRKYGVVLELPERDGDVPLEPLRQAMAKCGATLAVQVIEDVAAYSQDGATTSQQTILKLKSQGVTSVVCLCWAFRQQYLPIAATNQDYFPEWIMSSYGLNDTSLWLRVFWTSEQRTAVFGITSRPPALEAKDNPVCYAATESSPTAACGTEAGKDNMPGAPNVYWSLLLIASGIQMAGPHLTPATFAAALQTTRFPYPAADPTHAGDVGFLDGDHSMTDDFAEYWWSETAPSADGQDRGTICYVDHASRRQRGAWPRGGDPFFAGPCDPSGSP
jgi:hypothetical protein